MDINVALNFKWKKKTEIETKQRDAFLSQQLLLIWSFSLISAQAPRFFYLRRIALCMAYGATAKHLLRTVQFHFG